MEVKGTALASLPPFIMKKFGQGALDQWLGSLPESSRKVYSERILASNWFPLKECLVDPTMKMCQLFFRGDARGAWEAGRFSADQGLTGVYKFFVKLGSPESLIRRATSVFTSYYQPSEIAVTGMEAKKATLRI
ncbi:MAG TPA: hypothetical protein VLS90_21675, partial [Thermodesulfobacteriota bacterium]|nr:hypothetical protein [Thermodesulfobacteriota bacterium]